MSLLTSTNLANATQAHWLANHGTAAAPVIPGNPVQLCTNGPVASSVSTTDCRLFAPGGGSMKLGTLGGQNNIQIGPGLQNVLSVDTILNGPAGTDLQIASSNAITMLAGSSLTFSNAGAPRGTFRSTEILTTPIPSAPAPGSTVALTNPVGLPEGLYAVLINGVASDGHSASQPSTVAYWTGTLWVGGAVLADNTQLAPNDARTAMTFFNNTGGNLVDFTARFVELAGAA